MRCPKISIITITYNSEKTVRETLESIRKQQYQNLEYIVIDGGSRDSTLKIMEEYKDIISKSISEPDNGISDAMNKGILLASGELVGIIHSDDLLAEDTLNHLARVWDGVSDVYYGHVIVMDDESRPIHVLKAMKDLHGMEYGFKIIHPAAFVTKQAYQKYGMYDLKYKCAMDYDLMLRFYKAGAKFHYLDKILAHYRVGGTNMKLREKTIKEVRDISISYGANPYKAEAIRMKKMLVDRLRPFLNRLHIHNSRVKKYEDFTDARS